MKTRLATSGDCGDIQALSRQLGYDYPVAGVAAKLAKHLADEDHRIIVSYNSESEGINGYVHLHKYQMLYFGDLLNILGIVVSKGERGRGIGTLLLQKSIEIARAMECIGIRANSGATRAAAHAFYLKNGFDGIKEQKRFLLLFDQDQGKLSEP